MIQTIHIGHLLRETVASPYRNLVTRPTGAAIRNRIQETMADSDCLTALLDFSGIELLDFSCADEVVAKLLLAGGERGRPLRGPAGTARGSARGDRARAHPPRAGRRRRGPGRRARRAAAAGLGDARRARGLRLRLRAAARSPPASWRRSWTGWWRAPRRRWRRSRAIACSAPRTTGTCRCPSHEPAPPRPVDHGDPRRAPPAARLDARRAGHPAEQHLRRPRSAATKTSSTAGTATIPPSSSSPRSTRCSRAPKTRSSSRAAWGPRRWRTSRCSGPATTWSAAAGSTAARSTCSTRSSTRFGIDVTYVEPDQPRLWRKSVRKATRAIFVETPTNPLMRVVDLGPVAHVAREFGLALLVDATFASPINFRPLEHGADIVITSATKYLNGHSDVIAGVVAGSTAFVEEVNRLMRLWGQAIDPHAAWLVDRGMRTLALRMARHNANGAAVAAVGVEACRVRQGPLSRPRRPPGPRPRRQGARRLRRHGRARARRRDQGGAPPAHPA